MPLTLEDYWRGIVLQGRNSASYKFALAKSLLQLKPQSGDLLKLEDIAPIFAKNILAHLKYSDIQGVSKSSKFLDMCRLYNSGSATYDDLIAETIKYGFNNVIDAFHTIGTSPIEKKFYIDERRSSNGIRITDELNQLLDNNQANNLLLETESRWRLVETAWNLNINRSLISVDYDEQSGLLFPTIDKNRRKSITSSRDALSGYQKGVCFYCFNPINLDDWSNVDVDHFFPHKLKQYHFKNVDGVWNLVLSCQSCNRGLGGKFDSIPKKHLLKRLHTRNEFLISSHHPLKETLISQTGSNEAKRKVFLNDYHKEAHKTLIQTWEPKDSLKPIF